MIIGIDFDNTIADYTGVFHKVAVSLEWLPKHVGTSKQDVKRYFIEQNQEPKWTELQGIVYGKEIHQAKPYKGCVQAITKLVADGHHVCIISHKTKYPIIGDKVCFHGAALAWLEQNKLIGNNAPLEPSQIFFNATKTLKVEKIYEQKCDVFIDDLPEIFSLNDFPAECKTILFSPTHNKHYINQQASSWRELSHIL